MDRVHLTSDAAKAVQAYIEYEQIVGGADGGKLLSEAEYEEFKRNIAAKRGNRLFVYWTNEQGVECKTIGPFSKCFCDHRYRDHETDNVKTKRVPCKVPKCKCRHFNYVPIYGSNDLKCLCKHSFKEHNPQTKTCSRSGCRCQAFSSTHSCSCSLHYNVHTTTFETKDERVARGKPIGGFEGDNMYAALGGLTDMSSLVDGVERQQAIEAPSQMAALTGASRRAIEPGRPAPRTKPRRDTADALSLFMTPHSLS